MLNPIAFQIGTIQIHWYGIMYAITFLLAWIFLNRSTHAQKFHFSETSKDLLLTLVILAIILGGRLGYVLFYNLEFYLQNPQEILAIWQGGLSFHGGALLTIAVLYFFARKEKIEFLKLTDLTCLFVPIGIFFGRIGNFINGELYGRITNNGFCINFAADPKNCRYPSQLFEALGEGLLLYILLNIIASKNPKPGYISSSFLMLYGLIRFNLEFFREPDSHIGYIFQNLTLGQIFSLLTFLLGLTVYIYIRKTKKESTKKTTRKSKKSR